MKCRSSRDEMEIDERNASSSTQQHNIDQMGVSKRKILYKNKGLTQQTLRRAREVECFQLRKAKRIETLSKKRNIELSVAEGADDNADPISWHGQQIIANLFSNDPSIQMAALRASVRWFNQGITEIEDWATLGLVDRIIFFTENNKPIEMRRAATKSLSGALTDVLQFLNIEEMHKLISTFIDYFSSDDFELRQLSVEIIGLIANEGMMQRDLCIELGAVPATVELLKRAESPLEVRYVTSLIPMLCNCGECCRDLIRMSSVLYVFQKQLLSVDDSILICTLEAVFCLSLGPNENIEVVVSSAVIDCGALHCVRNFLENGDLKIKKETCWMLSNILADSTNHVQEVISIGILPLLVKNLSSGDFKIRKEACHAVVNALIVGNIDQVLTVINEGAISALCDLLTVMEPRIVHLALTGIENALKKGEELKVTNGVNPFLRFVEEARGIEKLEFLQLSPNMEIYLLAHEIMETFYSEAYENDPLSWCDICQI